MQDEPPVSPFLSVPPVVVALAGAVFLIECAFTFAEAGYIGGPSAIGWRLLAVQDYGFSDPVFDWMLTNRTFPPEHLLRFITYPFFHLGYAHLIFVVVFLLAIGKAITGVFNTFRFLVLFFGASIFGAVVFGLAVSSNQPLTGGFPGAYGLIGAYTFILWVRAKNRGEAPIRAFSLIAVLAGVQLVFGALFGSGPQWIAELSGFAFGFLISFVLAPGGWAWIRTKLRHR